ncbi:helix-turn-helix transcriptional regulator [Cohnella mopanensis]|uniref:helix-turn-helix transcriptional regulator n=1 Tax=Cohnella mopanensis TaxID=2911966 RepID=UPI001EF7E49A|nr:WYL domain-containing protein [Cohnella mopanensis]
MRADRLLMILSLLQTYGRLSSRELANHLEVSERTIHRDMEALGTAGIPVYAERGSKGGWTLSEGYRNQITGMTIEEIRSLMLLHSSSIVRDLGLNDQARTAFRKLLSALPATARMDAEYVRERIHIDGAGWHPSAPSGLSQLHTVQESLWAQRKIRITYLSWDSATATERVVCPLGLVAKQSIWYMIAQTDEEIRTYRISRLQRVDRLEEAFDRPDNFDLADFWEQSTARFRSGLPRYPAQVRIASVSWSKFVQTKYVKIVNQSEEQGAWVKAEVEFQTLESARDIMLGFGRFAQAIAPDQLRTAIYAESKAIASLYESEQD